MTEIVYAIKKRAKGRKSSQPETPRNTTCNDSIDDSNNDDKCDSHKEDKDVVLTLRDEKFNDVIMEQITLYQRHVYHHPSSSYRKEAFHSIAKGVMNDLKKGGGALLLQVGGGRHGSFKGYKASNDAEAIKREFDQKLLI